MGRRAWISSLLAALMIVTAPGVPVRAQQVSPQLEEVTWCAAFVLLALEYKVPVADPDVLAAARDRLFALLERLAAAEGVSPERMRALSRSSGEEIGRQLLAYRQNGDGSVFRRPPRSCLTLPDTAASPAPVPAPMAPRRASAEAAIECYFLLMTYGVRQGFAHGDLPRAGDALAASQIAYLSAMRGAGESEETIRAREAEARKRSSDAVERLERRGDAAVAGQVESCLGTGAAVAAVRARHDGFLFSADERLWCWAVLRFFDQQRLIGGGETRIARARKALDVLESRIGLERGSFEVASDDFDLIRAAYWQRGSVQGHRLASGDADAMERNYLRCFDWASRSAIPDVFAIPERFERPVDTLGGYDVEEGFVLHIWCANAMQALADAGLVDRFGWDIARVREVAAFALQQGFEMAQARAIPTAHYQGMVALLREDALEQTASFSRSGDTRAFDFDPADCYRTGSR